MKQSITSFIKKTFFKLGIYDFIRKNNPNNKVAILRYHAVVDDEDNDYTSLGISLSRKDFERHVWYFSRNYNVLSLDDIVEHIKNKIPLPTDSIAFTFDDGYMDNYYAAKIMKNYGCNGTFFIVTEPVNRRSLLWLVEVTCLILSTRRVELKILYNNQIVQFLLSDYEDRWKAIREIIRIIKSNDRKTREDIRKQILQQLKEDDLLKKVENTMLNRSQIKEMSKMGMIIGSHTTSHLNLPNAKPEDAILEIVESKKEIEKMIGKKANHFSYPNSGPYEYFNNDIKSFVKNSNYESACTSINGFVDLNSDLYALKRVRTVPALEDVIHYMEWDRVFGNRK